MKKYSEVLGVHVHRYAPELNTLVFNDLTEAACPQMVEPKSAFDYYVKTQKQ